MPKEKKEKRTDTVRAARSEVVKVARGLLSGEADTLDLRTALGTLDDRLAASATMREAQKELEA